MNDYRNLSNATKVTLVKGTQTAATSAVASDSVDMEGFRGVMFLVLFGTAAANNTINAAQSSDDSTFADLAGTEVASGSAESVWLDIYDPSNRYVRCEVARGTSSTIAAIYAFQYDQRKGPANNNVSGETIGELHVAPAEGTA